MYFNREVEFNRRCSQFTRDTRISDGPWMRLRAWLLPVREAQSAVTIWTARRESTGEEKHTTTAKKMSSFFNKFSAYTMTQLNEILEDDEKLTKMVQEMDEVCYKAISLL